jgi:hypothetical protein
MDAKKLATGGVGDGGGAVGVQEPVGSEVPLGDVNLGL